MPWGAGRKLLGAPSEGGEGGRGGGNGKIPASPLVLCFFLEGPIGNSKTTMILGHPKTPRNQQAAQATPTVPFGKPRIHPNTVTKEGWGLGRWVSMHPRPQKTFFPPSNGTPPTAALP